LHYDQVGSLRVVTDETGAARKSVEHDSFGNLIADSNPSLEVLLGFAGGLGDPDTGLTHFGAREYDPVAGRWISTDPIGLAGGDVNLYGYCLGDPVGLADPAGLITVPLGMTTPGLFYKLATGDSADIWVPFWESEGRMAVEYWAEESLDPCNSSVETWADNAMLGFASLWTPATSDSTVNAVMLAFTLDAGAQRIGSLRNYRFDPPKFAARKLKGSRLLQVRVRATNEILFRMDHGRVPELGGRKAPHFHSGQDLTAHQPWSWFN
jgi:RHS repeat-associated protein